MTKPAPTHFRAIGHPRLITRSQLRAYLQMLDEELATRIKRGQIPGPMWGGDPALDNARWDRVGVDRALDRASLVPSSLADDIAELDAALGTSPRGPARPGRNRP